MPARGAGTRRNPVAHFGRLNIFPITRLAGLLVEMIEDVLEHGFRAVFILSGDAV